MEREPLEDATTPPRVLQCDSPVMSINVQHGRDGRNLVQKYDEVHVSDEENARTLLKRVQDLEQVGLAKALRLRHLCMGMGMVMSMG